LLGTVPLDPELRVSGDAGEPLVWSAPEADSSRAIIAIAEAVVGLARERGVGQVVKPLPVLSG
jgi:ATP-binding protein involved in chromosome partitioning